MHWSAATAAAEPPEEPPGMRSKIPRIARWKERGVLRRGAHGEFIKIGLADDAPRRRREVFALSLRRKAA